MHREANLYDHYFSNFGRPPVPYDLSKDSAPRRPRFWRRRFLKVFTIYGHGGHLGQSTVTILAIFHSPNLRRLHMKFVQNWPRAPEEKLFEILNIFPYKCIRKQNWPHGKKVKCQCTTIILATLVDLQILMTYVKIQPHKASLVLENKIFKGFSHINA